MIVASEHQSKAKAKRNTEIDKKASKRARGRQRRTVTSLQTYPKGWQRIREL